MRRISTALSMSPSASASAALQSIMPAPVRSRRAFTSAAEPVTSGLLIGVEGAPLARRRGGGRRRGGLVGREACLLGLAAGAILGLAPLLLLGLAAGAILGLAPLLLLALAARPLLLVAEDRRVLGHDTRDALDDELARANGVVVAGDDVVHRVRVAVRVDQAEDRDLQARGLAHADRLGLEVHDEHRVGHALHVAHAAEVH